MRLSPVWVAVMAISAPLSFSVPANGQSSELSPVRTKSLSLPRSASELMASPEVLKAQGNTPITPSQNDSQPTQNTTTPNNTQPKPNATPVTPDTTQPTPLIIRPPGGGGLPQQETPNRIQIPINPGKQPSIQNNVPPSTQPSTPEVPGAQPSTAPQSQETRVLVGEVVIRSEQGPLSQELQNQVYGAISTQPGKTTSRSALQEDINSIFTTGFFSDVRAVPEDTPLGVRVTFVVRPNPVLRNVQVQANVGTNVPSVLPPSVIQNSFRQQYGSILNLRSFETGIKNLNKWYQDNGYVLAQVVGAPQVAPDGTVTLQVAEGVISDIQVRLRNKKGEETNANGKPYRGRTRKYIVTRELELRPGKVFNRTTVQSDLQRVYRLGIFEDAKVALNPAPQDPRQVIVVLNVNEKSSASISAGGGIGSASGLFGTVSYQQQNFNGRNQNLGAEVEIGSRSYLLFDLRFTDPWIKGDPYRTSYTAELFDRQVISLVFDGKGRHGNYVYLPNGDRPRIQRLGAGIDFTRPLSKNPFKAAEWTASVGFRYQRVSLRDSNNTIRRKDSLGNNLSFSGTGQDDLLTFQAAAVRDHRNDPLTPTSGSFLRLGAEQSVPVGLGSILLNRVRGSYSKYFPVNFTHFKKGPQTLAFNLQAGTIIGDLPPYEAFSLGGIDSVRGYDEGDVGSGRSFVQGTAEYRFPLFSIIGGALFFDAVSDLGTGKTVPGNPAGIRGKTGSGFGYGHWRSGEIAIGSDSD